MLERLIAFRAPRLFSRKGQPGDETEQNLRSVRFVPPGGKLTALPIERERILDELWIIPYGSRDKIKYDLVGDFPSSGRFILGSL